MSTGEDSDVPSKRPKLQNDGDQEDKNTELHLFEGFQMDRVLNDNPQKRVTFVMGRFAGSQERAVVTLEKTPFSEESVKGILTGQSKCAETLKNDIYGTYDLTPAPEFSSKSPSFDVALSRSLFLSLSLSLVSLRVSISLSLRLPV